MSLADFYDTIRDDPRIGPGHIVVYIALLHIGGMSNCIERFEVASYELMQLTKIRKRDTVLLRMKELASFGYIRYTPAENEYIKAVVVLRKL